jgi:hypothetical protein
MTGLTAMMTGISVLLLRFDPLVMESLGVMPAIEQEALKTIADPSQT